MIYTVTFVEFMSMLLYDLIVAVWFVQVSHDFHQLQYLSLFSSRLANFFVKYVMADQVKEMAATYIRNDW